MTFQPGDQVRGSQAWLAAQFDGSLMHDYWRAACGTVIDVDDPHNILLPTWTRAHPVPVVWDHREEHEMEHAAAEQLAFE